MVQLLGLGSAVVIFVLARDFLQVCKGKMGEACFVVLSFSKVGLYLPFLTVLLLMYS